MTRSLLIALVACLAIVAVSVGTAVAFKGEGTPADEGDNVQRVVELLGNAGIDTDSTEIESLAADHGMGGAIRILAFANAAGVDPSEIISMRDDGMGWGQIARDLDLDIGPGLGWIMSGNGASHGQGHGQGHGHGWGPGGNPNGDDDEAEATPGG